MPLLSFRLPNWYDFFHSVVLFKLPFAAVFGSGERQHHKTGKPASSLEVNLLRTSFRKQASLLIMPLGC